MPKEVSSRIDQIVATLDKHKLPVLDHLVMHYVADSLPQKRTYYINALRNLPEGVSEIIVHLGYFDSELAGITSSPGLRDGDRRVFTDPALAEQISKFGIEIINWKQFHEMVARDKESTEGDPSK
jgi:hypothetical protein